MISCNFFVYSLADFTHLEPLCGSGQAVHSPKTQNVKLTTAILEPYAWPCRKGTLDLTTLNKIECLGRYEKVLFTGFKQTGAYIIK